MSPHERRRAAVAAVRAAWSTLVPVSCAGCGEPDAVLCPECQRVFSGPLVEWIDGGIHGAAAAGYGPLAARVILAYKGDGRTELTRPLAAALVRALVFAAARAAEDGTGTAIELVTVPATAAGQRRRGFHPVGRLLASSSLRAPQVLRWERQPADQRGLGRAARLENLRGALAAKRDLSGRGFILVEDVVTTGATSREAARAIAAAGGAVRGIAALARA